MPWCKPAIAVAFVAVLCSIGCTNSAETSEHDKVAYDELIQQQNSQFDESMKETELEIVNLDQGTLAGAILRSCYASGYSHDGKIRGDLSNRRKAECDAIIHRQARIQAANAAEEKRLDTAYDKQHPQSKETQ